MLILFMSKIESEMIGGFLMSIANVQPLLIPYFKNLIGCNIDIIDGRIFK
jgi:hypothetical protein